MADFLKPLVRSVDWIHRHHAGAKRPECALVSCPGAKPLWQRLLRRSAGVFLHGQFYCRPQCLETALMGQISRLRALTPSVQTPHRIPLGLLMVARGKITHLEVRAALEAQRRARYGSIGDWIEKLGFASEQDVTAALALQWGCPVASSFDHSIVDSIGNIPLHILEAFQMIPFNYAASTNTLYLAFGARVDHAALYAIERILDCRTQPCVAPSRSVARQLEQLRLLARPNDVEFVTGDLAEMARITSSYIARLSPEDVRLSRVGRFIWLRLKGRRALTNLLFCLLANSPQPHASRPSFPAGEQSLPTMGRAIAEPNE
jgi:hypothetical protein